MPAALWPSPPPTSERRLSLGNKLLPGWLWFSTNVYDFRHISFLFENMTAVDMDANASLSTRVKNDTSFLNEDPFKPNLFNQMGDRD